MRGSSADPAHGPTRGLPNRDRIGWAAARRIERASPQPPNRSHPLVAVCARLGGLPRPRRQEEADTTLPLVDLPADLRHLDDLTGRVLERVLVTGDRHVPA